MAATVAEKEREREREKERERERELERERQEKEKKEREEKEKREREEKEKECVVDYWLSGFFVSQRTDFFFFRMQTERTCRSGTETSPGVASSG